MVARLTFSPFNASSFPQPITLILPTGRFPSLTLPLTLSDSSLAQLIQSVLDHKYSNVKISKSHLPNMSLEERFWEDPFAPGTLRPTGLPAPLTRPCWDDLGPSLLGLVCWQQVEAAGEGIFSSWARFSFPLLILRAEPCVAVETGRRSFYQSTV